MSDYDSVYKVLIIDDDQGLQKMLRVVLSAHGFDVVSAFTGEEGLALAKVEKPDVIVLDVMMPGIKGRDV